MTVSAKNCVPVVYPTLATCSWPPQVTLATYFLSPGLDLLPRTPTALAVSVDPQNLPRSTQLLTLWTPGTRASEPPHSLRPVATMCPHTWHPAPLDLRLLHAPACPHVQVDIFSY